MKQLKQLEKLTRGSEIETTKTARKTKAIEAITRGSAIEVTPAKPGAQRLKQLKKLKQLEKPTQNVTRGLEIEIARKI